MQKFKQIGLKSQEAVVSVDATSGEIVKTGETETSRFEKFDKPSRDSTANTTIPPWLQQQQQRKRASVLPPPKRPDAEQEEEDAAALFAAAGTKPVEVIARNEDDDAAALFAAAGSQPAIKVGVETDEENDDAAALFAAAGTATIPTGLSVEDEELADRYRRMLKMGMPEGAVVQKMNIDEVPSQIQDAVLKPAEETPTGLSAEDEEIAEKYRKMFKMGMPEGAVVQKMSIDEVPSHIQEAVLKPPEEAPVPTQTPAPVIDTFDTLSIEEEIIIEEVMDESIVEESMLAESVTGSQSTQTKAVEPSQDQASLPLEPSEQRMSDEDFGERWVVDKDRVLRDLNTTRFEEVEVSRDTGHVHYDEIYIDENGNEVVLRHRGKEAEPEEVQEIYVDEDGNTIDDDLLLEETEDIPPVQQSPSLVPSHVHTKEDPPSEQPLDPPSGLPLEPPHDPAYDVENQRKLLEREFKAYRSRMAWWVPYAFVFVIAGASILVLFFVVLADDDGIDVKSIPTAAPTPRDYIPLDPTNTGAIDVAATTPLEPVTGNCNFRGIEQPHVIDQCSCDGEITIVANDIRQRYESLLVNFLPDVIPDFDESLDSCDPKNQALIWLSSGTNNAGEAELYVRRERYALAYFYLDQGGVAWSDNGGWLSEEDTCQWDRATCDQDGRVVSLDITDNGIIGQVSAKKQIFFLV